MNFGISIRAIANRDFQILTDPEATVLAKVGGISDGTFSWGRNNFSPRETLSTATSSSTIRRSYAEITP